MPRKGRRGPGGVGRMRNLIDNNRSPTADERRCPGGTPRVDSPPIRAPTRRANRQQKPMSIPAFSRPRSWPSNPTALLLALTVVGGGLPAATARAAQDPPPAAPAPEPGAAAAVDVPSDAEEGGGKKKKKKAAEASGTDGA